MQLHTLKCTMPEGSQARGAHYGWFLRPPRATRHWDHIKMCLQGGVDVGGDEEREVVE